MFPKNECWIKNSVWKKLSSFFFTVKAIKLYFQNSNFTFQIMDKEGSGLGTRSSNGWNIDYQWVTKVFVLLGKNWELNSGCYNVAKVAFFFVLLKVTLIVSFLKRSFWCWILIKKTTLSILLLTKKWIVRLCLFRKVILDIITVKIRTSHRYLRKTAGWWI